LATTLLEKGDAVLAIDCFRTGEASGARNGEGKLFTTYNLTDDANRVQDILTAIAYAKKIGGTRVNLVGVGRAGLWTLLARDVARAAVDADSFRSSSDDAFVETLFIPGLRRAGDFLTAAALAAPAPLFVHGTGGRFNTHAIADLYRTLGAAKALQTDTRTG